jgi:hypothetical protein
VRGKLALAVSAVFALGAGCADNGSDPNANACRPPTCTPAKSSYAAEVISVGSSGPPAIEFSDLILDDASGYFVMTMPPAATVSGHVTAAGQAVASSVVFSRPSRIPGRPPVTYTATVDGAGAYTIALPPNVSGEDYLVRVQPMDTSHYPPKATTVHVEGDQDLELGLASGDQLATLTGTVKDVVGTAAAARVVLRDAVTLLDVSTRAATDADGRFSISMPLDATALSSALVLSIERGDPATGVLSMTVELKPDQVQAELIDAAMAIQLPTLQPPSHLKFAIIGGASNGTDKPVAGAHVVLRATVADTGLLGTTRATHEVETQTDLYGNFTADLYPEDGGTRIYTIAISPTDDSDFQTTTSTISVGAPSGVSTTIKLMTRPILRGRVLDPGGVPLKGAVVQPTLDAAALAVQASSAVAASKSSTATTDADGRFSLRLDMGSYELGISPPASSHLPRRWLPSRTVDNDIDLGDLVTPMAIEFDGVVVDQSSNPLRSSDGAAQSSSVRLYLVPAGNANCAKDSTDCLAPPRLQAEGTTNKDGRAALLLAVDGT